MNSKGSLGNGECIDNGTVTISTQQLSWLCIQQLEKTRACVVRATAAVAVTLHGTGEDLDTCCSTTYMSQTRDRQRFAILVVAADWHEPGVLQRIMWPSVTDN